MKIIFLVLLPIFYPSLSYSAETILCKSPGSSDVSIRFSEFKKFEKAFDCIHGDFVNDISGCAPDGEFALHAPTGEADIVSVVDRPQDYSKHSGPIMSHYVTKDKIYFAGGSKDSKGYRDWWTFEINRLTGKAQASIDNKKVEYTCEKTQNKL